MVATATPSPKTAPLARAFDRATDEKIVVYRIDAGTLGVAAIVDGVWTDKPYRLTVAGDQPQDVACDCPAGQHSLACKHLAAAIFSRKYGVIAKRPEPKPARATCPTCGMDMANPLHTAFCDA